ncbi:signal recognition particle-docking protein FtsY [Candidatus Bipolaricaulota bacterium]|nr:signal recognition particle-docking protein FtsY [Candidatus Bipolaricaulota bacterium]
MAWIDRLRSGLGRSRNGLIGSLRSGLSEEHDATSDPAEMIEEALIASDIGPELAAAIAEEAIASARGRRPALEDVLSQLRRILLERLEGCEKPLRLRADGEPTVILLCGVNGAGKTTTLAKLSSQLLGPDGSPSRPAVFAAADTFRAAAIEQLEVWGARVGAELVRHQLGADPSAVVYDAIGRVERTGGVLFIDTAGRLQTNHNLMEELQKIERTAEKRLGRPVDERLLVLDATTGQNGLSQGQRFHEAVNLTGIVITKLDGTARGGIVVSVWERLRVPLMYIGVGEARDDLRPFSVQQFVDALLEQPAPSQAR